MKLNILKKISYLFLSLALITSFTSCEPEESVAADSPLVLQEVMGSYWIIALEADGETPAYGGEYNKFGFYNSGANDMSFWLDDYGAWMELKAKSTIDLNSLTFSSEANTDELITGGTVTITNGKITENSYTTASGSVVDEIYFEAEFDWDPGYTYVFKGHKSTGIIADNHPSF
jgi:hypothetical protein